MGVAAWIGVLCALSAAASAGQADDVKSAQPKAAEFAGVRALQQAHPDLTGAGVKLALISRSITYVDGEPQNDYRPAVTHRSFSGKNVNFHDQGALPAGISPHSTAICSILLGEDPNGYNPELGGFSYRGIVPDAQLDVYELWHFLTNNVFPGLTPDVDILTASIGQQTEDWWTRGIEAMAENNGLIVVAGIGNGLNAHDGLLYPGAGSNVIGVGVVSSVNTEDAALNLEQFALAYPEDSSFGPTVDGRCKPDIVAPGNCMAANSVDPNAYEATGDWSSFSTPVVAGTIGLLVQKAKQDPNLSAAVSPEGGNCAIKAILLNSATKLPYWHKGRPQIDDDHEAPLDYIQGAGVLNATDAFKQLVAGLKRPDTGSPVGTIGWDNNVIDADKNSKNVYEFTLSQPADKVVTVTAVWNNHFSNEYPFEATPEKDSNLRIELWAVDPEKPQDSHLLDYSDSKVDNVEHIYYRTDDRFTHYRIVVSFTDTKSVDGAGKAQRYALAWNVGDKPAEDSIFWYDLNADGIVDMLDVITVTRNYLMSIVSPDYYFIGDENNNGLLDRDELETLQNRSDRRADWYEDNAENQHEKEYAQATEPKVG